MKRSKAKSLKNREPEPDITMKKQDPVFMENGVLASKKREGPSVVTVKAGSRSVPKIGTHA